MKNINDYFDLTTDEVREEVFLEHLKKITDISDTDFSDISDSSVLSYAKIEMASFPTKMTISSGMTRQKQQYCPNSYHVSIELDLSMTKDVILSAVEDAPTGEKMTCYKDLKSFLYKSIFAKYAIHETLIRENMVNQARADGVTLAGE